MSDNENNQETTGVIDPQDPAAEKLSSGQEHLKHAAEDLKAAAEAKAHQLRALAEAKASELRGKAEHFCQDAQTKAKGWQGQAETFVRENPTKALLYALGTGFLLGLLIRR